MSLPRYPQYKPSGVEWLGEIPAHWDVVQMRHLAQIQNGADHKNQETETGVPVYGSGGVFSYVDQPMFVGESVLLGRKGTIDRPLYVCGPFWTVDTMFWTKTTSRIAVKYLYFSALSIPFGYYSTNTALPSMAKSDLAAHSLAVPPLQEQRTIATFLDRETAKIDVLVQAQELLIELLKEKRQALITHAVTKGLDPSVPMKDSGVEWLGEIPAHWQSPPIRHVMTMVSGGTPSKERADFWNGDFPWASSKDLKGEQLIDTQDHITDAAIEEGAAKLLEPGCVLVVVRGMILAHTFPVVRTLVSTAINQDVKALRGRGGLSSAFLAWSLRGAAREILGMMDEAGHGTKVLRMERWLTLKMPVPPPSEQEAIVDFLDRETARLDLLTTEAQRAIALLKERRAALITAAVTGQIDVRSAVGLEAA